MLVTHSPVPLTAARHTPPTRDHRRWRQTILQRGALHVFGIVRLHDVDVVPFPFVDTGRRAPPGAGPFGGGFSWLTGFDDEG